MAVLHTACLCSHLWFGLLGGQGHAGARTWPCPVSVTCLASLAGSACRSKSHASQLWVHCRPDAAEARSSRATAAPPQAHRELQAVLAEVRHWWTAVLACCCNDGTHVCCSCPSACIVLRQSCCPSQVGCSCHVPCLPALRGLQTAVGQVVSTHRTGRSSSSRSCSHSRSSAINPCSNHLKSQGRILGGVIPRTRERLSTRVSPLVAVTNARVASIAK